MKTNKCKHEECIVFDTCTEYREMAKCTKCNHTMTKHEWIINQALKKKSLGSWIRSIDPISIDVAMMYFALYVTIMIIYAYYSL